MKLQIKKEVIINDISMWFKYAEPEGGESQWKEGRSAMEFARYMTASKGKMPVEIQNYLKRIGFSEDDDFTCYPEEVTKYDCNTLGTGSGRHHDGLLVSKNYLIGIEAKVSEPFDEAIQNKIEKSKSNKDKGENMKKRIVNSLKMFKPEFEEQSLDSVGHLMYQLVSGTVGTIIEARNRKINNAAFLVMEFESEHEEKDYKDDIMRNQEAYNAFLTFIGLLNKEDKERYIQLEEMRIWFKKIKIKISKETYKYTEIK